MNYNPVYGRIELPVQVPYRPAEARQPRRGDIMPASKSDVRELRGLLWFLENPDKKVDAQSRREQIDALKRALQIMEYGDPQSPLWWAAGALKKATQKIMPGRYIIDDPTLYKWAMEQIHEMFPEE